MKMASPTPVLRSELQSPRMNREFGGSVTTPQDVYPQGGRGSGVGSGPQTMGPGAGGGGEPEVHG